MPTLGHPARAVVKPCPSVRIHTSTIQLSRRHCHRSPYEKPIHFVRCRHRVQCRSSSDPPTRSAALHALDGMPAPRTFASLTHCIVGRPRATKSSYRLRRLLTVCRVRRRLVRRRRPIRRRFGRPLPAATATAASVRRPTTVTLIRSRADHPPSTLLPLPTPTDGPVITHVVIFRPWRKTRAETRVCLALIIYARLLSVTGPALLGISRNRYPYPPYRHPGSYGHYYLLVKQRARPHHCFFCVT